MAKIVDTSDWRKKIRDDFTAELLHSDRNPESDREIATLNDLFAKAPLADEEKLTIAFVKVVEHLAAIDDVEERRAYVKRISTLLNRDIVEAARDAFVQMK